MLCLALFVACAAASSGANFRGLRAEGAGRTVATEEVEANLRATLDAVLRGGEGEAAKHLESIEASIWQSFEALPKNELGRLGPRAVRYLVHNYFAKEHGWLIQGLEPHGNQDEVSEMHEVSILQDKAPMLVETLLEAKRGDRGLSLSDSVAMIAALERLIYDESQHLLQASYRLNGFAPAEPITESAMHEVLTSYLLLFEMGQKANLTDSRRHQLLKKRAAEAGGNWPLLVAFERDSVLNYVSSKTEQGALDQQHFTFQESTAIMEGLAKGYGKWQHSECQAMKKDLMQLDADGTGRVPVSKFYSQPDTADYHFTESLDYLKTIGALDETGRGEARVRIANYMAGPSNCIASSSYYSVCCLNECEGLMNQLEAKVHAPTAAPEKLLNMVMNMSSDTVNAPRQLPKALQDRLHEIASRNDGEVPLHGRLFAQWMHHAFPNECAHPEITEDAAVLTPSHWLDKTATVKASEREKLATAEPAKVTLEKAKIDWSDEERLHAHAVPAPAKARSTLSSVVRVAMQLAMLLGLLRMALGSWQTATGASSYEKSKKFDLPF